MRLNALKHKGSTAFLNEKTTYQGRSFVGLKFNDVEFLFAFADFELVVLEILQGHVVAHILHSHFV